MLNPTKRFFGLASAGAPPCSTDVRWVFGRANQIALERGATYITSAHVLAAITEHPSAAEYLGGEINLAALRADVLRSSVEPAAKEDLKRVLERSVAVAERDGRRVADLTDIVVAMLESPELVATRAMRQKHSRSA